jgi:hypothetical protein
MQSSGLSTSIPATGRARSSLHRWPSFSSLRQVPACLPHKVDQAMGKKMTYPEELVQLGLRTLALCGGNTRRAAQILEADGNRIPQSTLHRWRDHTHARRYLEIRNEMQAEIGQEIADHAMEIAGQANEVEEQLIAKMAANVDDLPIENSKDMANAARSFASVAQGRDLALRNANLLREKPTKISRVENPAELIRELEALGVAKRREAITVEPIEDDHGSTEAP